MKYFLTSTVSLLAALLPVKSIAKSTPAHGQMIYETQDVFVKSPSHKDLTQRLPVSYDWRNQNGQNYIPVPKDQGACGSCVSFAAMTALEAQINITHGRLPWSLSRQHMVSCGAQTCRGWLIHEAPVFLRDIGAVDEACMPYLSGASGNVTLCNDLCTQSERSVRISNFIQPTNGLIDIDAIKKALLEGPLLTSMILFEDLYTYQEGVYRHRTGNQLGSHAIVLVGWDDRDQSWIAANSFGPEWGDQGFFKVAWNDQSLVGRYTWRFEVNQDLARHHAVIANINPNDLLTGNIPLQFESDFPGSRQSEWVIAKSMQDYVDNNLVLARTVNLVEQPTLDLQSTVFRGTDTLDTTTLADGEYVIGLRTLHAGGLTDSSPVQISILNGNFNGVVSLENLAEGQNIFSLKQLRIRTSASPINFRTIKVVVNNLQTGESWTRSTTNIADEMIFTLATQNYPDGDYHIAVSGEVSPSQQITSTPVQVRIDN
jgi:hypothetical protein